MTIEKNIENEKVTLTVSGRLDTTTAPELETVLDEVLEAVKLLTKQKGYIMENYVSAIRKNEIAFAVKGADRLHNLRCAFACDDDFKRRYILETVDWYLDFSPEIPKAVKKLAKSLDKPIAELPFLYEPVETWKINKI